MVTTASKKLQFTLALERVDDSDITATRTFSIDMPSSATSSSASLSAENFKTTYMSTYANKRNEDDTEDMGSLIQTTGWRDNDLNEYAYKCTGIKAVYIDETRYAFDETP